jgi:hypothetical protein
MSCTTGFFSQPIAALAGGHDRLQSGMVSSLATLLSMLGNIAQRLPRLWARVANLNELPGNSQLPFSAGEQVPKQSSIIFGWDKREYVDGYGIR